MIRSAALALTILAVSVQPLSATCLEQAVPELSRGTKVTILGTDGSLTRARFLRAESDPLRLVLEEGLEHSQRAPGEFKVPVSEISRLDAPAKVRFHANRIGIGTLVGFGVGSLVGAAVHISRPSRVVALDPYPYGSGGVGPTRINAIITVGFAAATLGALVGLLGSTAGGTPRSWSCTEARGGPPTGVQAPSDSLQAPIR